MSEVANRQRPGTAAYRRGQATAANILEAAKNIVVKEGLDKLSMRGLARTLGMSPGNLSYYYATKADLLGDLTAVCLEPYLTEFERLRAAQADAPEAQLRAVLQYVYDDLGAEETTHFFPQLWALSLRDQGVLQQMEGMYATYRSVLEEIITQMRPDLTVQTCQDLALAISAAIEGCTIFLGHQRPHRGRAPAIRPMLIEHLIAMVHDA